MPLHSQPQTVCTSLSGLYAWASGALFRNAAHFPFSACQNPRQPSRSTGSHFPDEALRVRKLMVCFLCSPSMSGVFLPRTLGVLPSDLVNCVLVCVSQQALRHQGLYFVHPYVLPGPRREVQMFHADQDGAHPPGWRKQSGV